MKNKINIQEMLWTYLVCSGRHKTLELCHRAEKGELNGKVVKIKGKFCSDVLMNNTIKVLLERNGAKIKAD